MRSSTLASIVTVFLSLQNAAALNYGRHRFPGTASLSTTQTLNQKHGDEAYGTDGESHASRPTSCITSAESQEAETTTAVASEESFTPTTFSFIPDPTPASSVPSSTEAAVTEPLSTVAASTEIPSGTHAVEEESNISTSNNANVEASSAAVDDTNGKQLSFVATTVFASGAAPTITVTAAPRTITQVQTTTVTVPQQSCEAQAQSTITLASNGATPEPVTITQVQTLLQSCEAPSTIISASSGAAPEPITITQIQTASPEATLEPATITQIITQIDTAFQAPALEPVTITQITTVLHEAALPQTITVTNNGISEIDAGPSAPVVPSTVAQNQNNNMEYGATISQTIAVTPTQIQSGGVGAGAGTVRPDGQCNCACACEFNAYSSTTFSFVQGTTSASSRSSSAEPTTTLRFTLTTLQTVVISGTSEAGVAPTTSAEAIELDTTAAPIVIVSSLISEPVISSIPFASFGVGDTTLGSSPVDPTTASSIVDTSIVLETSTVASLTVTETATTASSILDTSIALETSTVVSSTVSESTAVASSSATPTEEAHPVFTTTLDAPLATPEIGSIPRSQAGGEFFEIGDETTTAVESGVPTQTAAQAEAVVTAAPITLFGEEQEDVDIKNYSLSSAIVLGNLGA